MFRLAAALHVQGQSFNNTTSRCQHQTRADWRTAPRSRPCFTQLSNNNLISSNTKEWFKITGELTNFFVGATTHSIHVLRLRIEDFELFPFLYDRPSAYGSTYEWNLIWQIPINTQWRSRSSSSRYSQYFSLSPTWHWWWWCWSSCCCQAPLWRTRQQESLVTILTESCHQKISWFLLRCIHCLDLGDNNLWYQILSGMTNTASSHWCIHCSPLLPSLICQTYFNILNWCHSTKRGTLGSVRLQLFTINEVDVGRYCSRVRVNQTENGFPNLSLKTKMCKYHKHFCFTSLTSSTEFKTFHFSKWGRC